MAQLDASILRAIAPLAPPERRARQTEIINAVGPVLSSTLAGFEINTPLRVAHFLAQVTHECAAFSTTEEFASGAAYEGRVDLGNTQPGDGRRYKGRGLIQLTGRKNYRRYGAIIGQPLEDQPTIAAEPVISLTIACEYWKDNNLNRFADRDDIETVTTLINGKAMHGLEERKAYLAKAKSLLVGVPMPASAGSAATGPASAAGSSAATGPAASTGGGGGTPTGSATGSAGASAGTPLDLAAVAAADDPVLRNGDSGDDVVRLQNFLTAKGFAVDLSGEFDNATEDAVIAFQQQSNLDDDGVVGRNTWRALRQ
jgi:putative chitinase